MSLSSLQLDAFAMVAKSRSFSEAAIRLSLTQSALSQRILKLEEELQLTLFIRESSGVRLTESGSQLVRYCQAKESLEAEFFGRVHATSGDGLSGLVRLGAFSTYARSRLLPKIGEFGRRHPGVSFEVFTRELRELLSLLKSGAADFVFSAEPVDKQEYACEKVGIEESVLVEGTRKNARQDVYLDHDEQDRTTAEFWKLQKSAPKEYARAFFDEIYSVLDAVEEGLGRAVVPVHLVDGRKGIREVPGLRSLKNDVYLVYFKQAFYTRLHEEILKALKG